MADEWLYPACPNCKTCRYDIRQHKRDGYYQILCSGCHLILARLCEAAATVNQSAQGPYAPIGGPYRP